MTTDVLVEVGINMDQRFLATEIDSGYIGG